MIISRPDYYQKFECLADRCEETCCAGWQIMIDENALEFYKNVEGPFGEHLKGSIDWKEGAFHQDTEKRCAFLNENNLCDLYSALGESALCKTCTNYPRHIEEFENIREYTLSISCPEVARILFAQTEPVIFPEEEVEGDEEFEEEFDVLLFSQLEECRKVCYGILQNRGLSISLRARIVWEIGCKMQEYFEEGMLFSCDEIFEEYAQKEKWDELKQQMTEWRENADQVYDTSLSYFKYLYQMELLHEDWDLLLEDSVAVLYVAGGETYMEIHDGFDVWVEEHLPEYAVWMEQLLVYFVSTYFCGAVYDGCIDSKMKLAVISAYYIHEMLVARWYQNEQSLDVDDAILIAYRYSRELEHSDQNLEIMEELLA